ncbi:MAG: hypothetical protein H6Q90_484 [Deltaproteobacteria bacterium]|nr:hypothetical protein [Deltaproteobacteria bacterium]
MRIALLLVIALAACGKKPAAKTPASNAAPAELSAPGGGAGSADQAPSDQPAPKGAGADPCMGGE